ncbi:hypothetical protein DFH06DRAFT_1335306 [Mycena polygramma]|nr:hypothetical protein DFH06DRAFT_1335306 [Mycena polygramma]
MSAFGSPAITASPISPAQTASSIGGSASAQLTASPDITASAIVPSSFTSATAQPGATVTRKASVFRPVLIAVGTIVGIALVLSLLSFLVRRRRRRRQLALKAYTDVSAGPYREDTFSSSKAALNAKMRSVHARLQSRREPSIRENASRGIGGDAELHRKVAMLTAEVKRLRAMGAEEPPPYSESQPQLG